MRLSKWLCLLLGVMFASLAWAAGPDKVCEVNVTSPKPGAAKDYAEGRKKHNEFHKAEKDKHAIMVWEIATGPDSGKFLTAVCGMTWKEMDGNEDFDKRDGADVMATMAPSVASNRSSYYIFRDDLSLGSEGGAPAKMMTVLHFFVKPGGVTQFTDSVKKINAAIQKTKYPAKPSRWYMLANGGEGPHFVMVTDRNSWADMQGPEKSLMDALKEAYGPNDKTLQTLREATDHTVSELLDYQADLSYMPAAQ